MNKSHASHPAQVTFRLSRDLDRQMRTTSEYFRRSVTEEWRAAGVVYQRVVRLWAATGTEAARGRWTEAEFVAELCAGVIVAPQSLADLRSNLGLGGRTQ